MYDVHCTYRHCDPMIGPHVHMGPIKILYRWPWRESVASVTACKEAAKVEWRFTQAISSLFTEASQLLPLNFFPFSVDNVHCSLMLMIAKIKLDANFVLQHVELIIRVLDRVRRVGFFNFGSGSGIEKIFRVGSGIGYLYLIPSQLGIMGYWNLDRVFAEYLPYFLYFLISIILFD